MRPINPQDHVIPWPGARFIRMNPPADHDENLGEILPVHGILDWATADIPRYHFMIGLEPGDLEKLKKRGWFWVVFYDGVSPFDVTHPEVEDWFEVEDRDVLCDRCQATDHTTAWHDKMIG